MNNPNNLPVATGASLGSVGADRPESITVDPGNAPRNAAPKATPIPPSSPPVQAKVPEPETAVAQDVPEVEETGEKSYQVTDEEIDQLHQRFDRMETMIKRRLAIATLHARFDSLEKWLQDRFS